MTNIVLLHGGVSSNIAFNSVLTRYATKAAISGASALDIVVKAVIQMENDIHFNAGTGAYERIDGSIQMDAAVMVPDRFGAVIGIENVKNPILVARDVMLETPHIILAGDGAVSFARMMGYSEYDPHTSKSHIDRQKILKLLSNNDSELTPRQRAIKKFVNRLQLLSGDTVGAVARYNGNFAAAVSTGGAAPMLRGRVGDTPLIGAGIYAGTKGSVVATGIGEEIAKRLLAFRIYEKIGHHNLFEILKKEVDCFNKNIAVGVIAVDTSTYAYYANRAMGVGIKEL